MESSPRPAACRHGFASRTARRWSDPIDAGISEAAPSSWWAFPDQKLLEHERDAVTQDFLLASAPRFFLRDAATTSAFAEAARRSRPSACSHSSSAGIRGSGAATSSARSSVGSSAPATCSVCRYWSQVPYRLGPHIVKYAADADRSASPAALNRDSPDFLRERAGRASRDASSHVRVLHPAAPESGARMPIEDATVEWPLAEAPFERVATLEIPSQRFDSPRADGACRAPVVHAVAFAARTRADWQHQSHAARRLPGGFSASSSTKRRRPSRADEHDHRARPDHALTGGSGSIMPPRPRSAVSRFIKLVAVLAAVAAVVLLVLLPPSRSRTRDRNPWMPLPFRHARRRSARTACHDAERGTYYHLSEGGELYPLDWLLALEVEYPSVQRRSGTAPSVPRQHRALRDAARSEDGRGIPTACRSASRSAGRASAAR